MERVRKRKERRVPRRPRRVRIHIVFLSFVLVFVLILPFLLLAAS